MQENAIIIYQNENNKIKQPLYSKGEEIFNYVSHIVGGAFGIFILIFSLIYIGKENISNRYSAKYMAMIIYSLSIIILYTMSTLYHALRPGTAKHVFRIFDHCTIFLLIAGTYTPFCLIAFHGTLTGLVLFIIQWSLAILGIVFNAINMEWKAVKILSQIFYLAMGWCIIFTAPSLIRIVSFPCFLWLIGGGIAYTLGIVFFFLGSRVKYFHSIWHLFDLLGTILQFISIMYIL